MSDNNKYYNCICYRPVTKADVAIAKISIVAVMIGVLSIIGFAFLVLLVLLFLF